MGLLALSRLSVILAEGYWVCITTDYTDFRPLPTTGKSVGADFGMKDAYLTLSTGEKIQHPQPLKHSLKKLRSLNKALSRKVKGSNGWWKCVETNHTPLSENQQPTQRLSLATRE